MSLGSPGKLGDSRPLGGTRGLLRREIRRNKDNPQVANKYREQLSDMNIARGMRGDSLIGSADSDAKEVVARRNMQMQQLGQGAGVATGSYGERLSDARDEYGSRGNMDVREPKIYDPQNPGKPTPAEGKPTLFGGEPTTPQPKYGNRLVPQPGKAEHKTK